jgi:hypothetical protein
MAIRHFVLSYFAMAGNLPLHGMEVITRNVADFKPTGVNIIDPWEGRRAHI